MDEGKAPGPKPKWWSRPAVRSAHQPAPAAPAPDPSRAHSADPDRLDAAGGGAGEAAPEDAAADGGITHGAEAVPGTEHGAERRVDHVRAADAEADADTADDAEARAGLADDVAAASSAGPGSRPEPVSAADGAAASGAGQGLGSDAEPEDAVPAAEGRPLAASGEGGVTPVQGTSAGVTPAHGTLTGTSTGVTPAHGTSTGVTPVRGTSADVTPAHGTPADAPPVRPLHAPDPYGTPPYGGPGPWAPAPPVQRPVATPAHGTHLPPAPHQPPTAAQHPGVTPAHGTPLPPTAGMTPAHGTQLPPVAPAVPGMTPAHGTQLPPVAPAVPEPPAAAEPAVPRGQWLQYDPWGAPRAAAPAVPQRTSPRRRARLLVGALLIALLAGGVGGGIGAYLERNGGVIGDDVELSQPPAEKEPRDKDSVAGIAARALPGVVTIHVSGGSEQGTGTGFVLDGRGHILTNNHVVEPAGSGGDISVTFSGGETAPAHVVGRDSGYDLAVVKVDNVSGLKPLPLGNSDSVRVGDPVVAIGAPYDLAGTVTSGIISAKERPITAGGQKEDGSDVSYVDALQTDAPINPGNSGGPLMDSKARVIGINSAIRAADDGTGLGPGQGGSIGLGFAIPINQGKRVAEELINTGKATHPVIGVTLDMGFTGDGARVNTKGADGSPPVTPGGPGDKAGIKPRDVITEVDGVRVHSGQELIVKIRSHRPGDRLRLTLERDGEERTVSLTLGTADRG
ncbi:trypsin-like peptidase domain-containing protein [Streptomyces sp. P1-3]|uniref:S1C family serine protease n=1 Tax=Streptomyces sp. P1-3 TaxID=3421658 RepID=UPI003D36A6FF